MHILQKWLAPLGASLPAVYLVGGAVRDQLLRRDAKDIDLMCADPEGFARRLEAAHRITVVPFLKKPGATCIRAVDRNNPEDFIDLVPIHGGSLERDLGRRDFTINAMALKVAPGGILGELVDPLGGRRDIDRRLIRAAGPRAFIEDPLRVLRAARFSAELGFEIDPPTLERMREAAGHLHLVAAERITRELFLILETPRSAAHIRLLDGVGALEAVLPEIGPMRGCGQNAYHHLDVWNHTLEAYEALEGMLGALPEYFGAAGDTVDRYLAGDSRVAVLKLALLLHDAGKPASRASQPADGSVTFHGHDVLGAAMAGAAGLRLKLSLREREALERLVRHHMHLFDLSGPGAGAKTLTRWFRRHGEMMTALVLLFLADTLATRGPAVNESERQRLLRWGRETVAAYYAGMKARLETRPLLTGRDLAGLGVAPGPAMGRILHAVREAQDAGALQTKEAALAMARMLLR